MSTPIDLSDALKTPPPSLSPQSGGKKGGGRGRGTGTRLDDIARPVLWIALALTGLLLLYLCWGLFGGTWADPAWTKPGGLVLKHSALHNYREQQMANIGFVFGLLRLLALVVVAALVICSFRDEGAGYALLGAAALLYFGLPLITGQVYIWQGLRATDASSDVLREMQTVALFYGLPGLIWTAVDVVRRFRLAAEGAAVHRANLKYATAAAGRSLGVKNPPRLTAQQRQYRTYQWLAVAVLVAEPVLVFANLDAVKDWTTHLLAGVEGVTNRFAFTPNPTGIAHLHDDSGGIILWSVLIAGNLALLSQALRLLEYFCFRRNR